MFFSETDSINTTQTQPEVVKKNLKTMIYLMLLLLAPGQQGCHPLFVHQGLT